MKLQGYMQDELVRWLWLRAVERGSLPAYVSQPVAPILFLFFPWYFVVPGIVATGLLWCLVRYTFVSANIASLVVLPVMWLKWPASIGCCIYLCIHHHIGAGVVALIWPLVAAFTIPPANVLPIQLALARQTGLLDLFNERGEKNEKQITAAEIQPGSS